MAGVGAGKWQRCSHGDGVDELEGASVPVGHRDSACGHARPNLQHEGRPPGDAGRLAAARFIRYLHSYSLPPREVSHGCERCREAAGATHASEGLGRRGRSRGGGAVRAAKKHRTVTIRKRDEKPGHPLLSQLLSSNQRPDQKRAHPLHLPSSFSNQLAGKRSKGPGRSAPGGRGGKLDGGADSQGRPGGELKERGERWVRAGTHRGLEAGRRGGGEDVGPHHHDDDDDDVDDADDHPVTGSPAAVLSPAPPSPVFPDTRIAAPTPPSITRGQGQPHRQALSKHPDDQGHPLLGNQDCIPPLGFPLLCPLPVLI